MVDGLDGLDGVVDVGVVLGVLGVAVADALRVGGTTAGGRVVDVVVAGFGVLLAAVDVGEGLAEVRDGVLRGAVVRGGLGVVGGVVRDGAGRGGVVRDGVVRDGVGRGAAAAGGRTPGGAPEPKAQPSTLPGGGSKLPAPRVEYVHEPPGRACQ